MLTNIVAAIGVILLFLAGALALYVTPAPPTPPLVATSTVVAVEKPAPTPTTPAPSIEPAPAPKTTVPAEQPVAAPAPKIEAPVVPVAAPTQSEFEATTILLRSALVNVLCVSGDPTIKSISGTGVIVHPNGIIVTNAHIAQYLLLTNDPSLDVECVVRTGSPAKNTYQVKPMFVSPTWISANASLFGATHAKGTGEYDFAFLAITGSATSAALPTVFPFIPFAESEAYAGVPVVVGSYAAQFLSSGDIRSSLYPTLVYGSVAEIFTFLQTTIDVITVGGSAAAQEGSSGGGIARADGTLAGVITTSTIEGDTSTRTLAGITAAYIRRDYQIEAGESLEALFAKQPIEAAALFAPKALELKAKLVEQITK